MIDSVSGKVARVKNGLGEFVMETGRPIPPVGSAVSFIIFYDHMRMKGGDDFINRWKGFSKGTGDRDVNCLQCGVGEWADFSF